MSRWYITAVIFEMKKQLIILSALVLFAFCGCQKFAGNPVTKYFSVDNTYTELKVEDGFEVTVSDTATQITITAGEYVMPNVEVKIDENTLKFYLKGWHTSRGTDMSVILPYNVDLTNVDLSGASEFHSEYGLEGDKVEVELSGASDFYCDIEADEVDMNLSGASYFEGYIDAYDLELEMSGGSDATLWGQVVTFDIDLSGGSTIKKTVTGSSYGFECDFCNGEMSGGSDAYIHCNLNIYVNLSGGSELHYTGAAVTTGSTCSGDSNISHDVPRP